MKGAKSVLIVDAANVVGSRPDGWWRDRPGAARRLHAQLLTADLTAQLIVMVVEGQAKAGVRAGRDAHVQVVHAARSGDDAIVKHARAALDRGAEVTVVTADRLLAARVAPAMVMSPLTLLAYL